MSSRKERRRKRRIKQMYTAGGCLFCVVAVILILVLSGSGKKTGDGFVPGTDVLAPGAVTLAGEGEADPVQGVIFVPAETEPQHTEQPIVFVTATPEPQITEEPTEQPEEKKELRSATFRAVGDVMLHEDQLTQAYQGGGKFDFTEAFSYIKDSLSCADYTIANLETTIEKINGKNYSGYPRFNSPEELLETLKDCGVDMLTLANNHILDRYYDGLVQTVEYVEKYGFDHVGANTSKTMRKTPVVVDVNGIKVGFIAYTEMTNGIEKSCGKEVTEYGVNYLNGNSIKKDVKLARQAGAEVIIAMPHWGIEYETTPCSSQRNYANKLIAAGVDVVLGSHPHVVQPIEYVTAKDDNGVKHKGLVVYSMGNFISNFTWMQTQTGMIVEFTINEHEDGSFSVDDVGYVPTYTWLEKGGENKTLAIGDCMSNVPEGLDKQSKVDMNNGLKLVRSLMDDKVATILRK